MGSFKDLLEEIPVTLRNPGIVSALLFDMQVRARQCVYVNVCVCVRAREAGNESVRRSNHVPWASTTRQPNHRLTNPIHAHTIHTAIMLRP